MLSKSDEEIIERRIAEYQRIRIFRKPLVKTGRKPIPIERYPRDVDFSKTIGSTTYVVKSQFSQAAEECLLGKALRLFDDEKNLSELVEVMNFRR